MAIAVGRTLTVLLAVIAAPAQAADISAAAYDRARDELVVDIVYRGTNPDHAFTLQWGDCGGGPPYRSSARLIDAQGRDLARDEYRVRERFSLAELQCRPAAVTLRLGRSALATVQIPAAGHP